MKKKLLTSLLIINLFWLGCGGREAHPMAAYQPGDLNRSCEGLRLEIAQLDADIAAKIPKSNKTGKNVCLGILGFFLIIPWFFMDPKNADKTELEAMRARYSRLMLIAGEKNCDLLVGSSTEQATNTAGTAESTTNTQQKSTIVSTIVVKKIIWGSDRPAALIGNQMIREGGSVSGARVVKINQDSVEFEMNGTTWRQGVSR